MERPRLQTPSIGSQTGLSHTAAPAGSGASPGCREVFTWRSEACPQASRRGRPGGREPPAQALRQGAHGGGGKWAREFAGDPRGGHRLGRLARSRCGPRPLAPPSLEDHPRQTRAPGTESRRHPVDQTGLRRQRSRGRTRPSGEPLTRLRGPSITSIDPGGRGGLREGSGDAEAHGGAQPRSGRQRRGPRLLSAPREPAEGAEGATTAPLPPPAPRARPLRRGHARVVTSHAVVQGGSEDGLWAGFREGGSRADVHFLAVYLSSREMLIFSFGCLFCRHVRLLGVEWLWASPSFLPA